MERVRGEPAGKVEGRPVKWRLKSVLLVRKARFLEPEPSVTLNTAHGVFLGPSRGRRPESEDGLCQGVFVERVPGGPRKHWNSRGPRKHWNSRGAGGHRRGQDESPSTWLAQSHCLCSA